MPPCHGGDRQFKSDPGRQCGSSSVVEHNLAKVGVAGSSPVFRSIDNIPVEILGFLLYKIRKIGRADILFLRYPMQSEQEGSES